MKRHQYIYLLFSMVIITSCAQEPKQVTVVPGLGIIVAKDTIKLAKTTECEIFKIFKMTDTLIEINHGTACGFNAAGESQSIITYHKDINYGGIVFNYSSDISKDKLTLEEIEIKEITHFVVNINDSTILGKSIPNLFKYFPKRSEDDEYENYWVNLYSYGINLGLDDNGSQKKLSYISIYKIY